MGHLGLLISREPASSSLELCPEIRAGRRRLENLEMTFQEASWVEILVLVMDLYA